ncbi:MAG TPA: FecR domain-containing protein [Polyangiaceae bacterium]|nr:FecR domain-containing protein [Polyangiaceae bacterium]
MNDLARKLEALGDHVRAEQDAQLGAEHSLGSVRQRLLGHERRARFKWSLTLKRGLLVAAAVGAVGAAVLSARLLRPPPLGVSANAQAVNVGDWIRVRDAAVAMTFSDGTVITLDPGSRARLEDVDAAGARLAIETGHADVKVVPGRDGRWHLSLGPFGVDVTGTQFDINWNPEAEELSLTMREGKVMVSGCVLGDGRPLLAGEKLIASCRDRRFEVQRAKPTVAENAPPPVVADTDSPAEEGAAAALAARAEASGGPLSRPDAPRSAALELPQQAIDSWQTLARAGKYKAALGVANNAGFDAELARSSAEDLSLLGDVARFAGSVDASIKAYQTLRRRFPHTPLAANAAFAIGRIEFDQRGAFSEAERWFANYLAEQPRGALAREALGRRMEALNRSGNQEAARDVALSYQKSYPRGPHIRLAESLLEPH